MGTYGGVDIQLYCGGMEDGTSYAVPKIVHDTEMVTYQRQYKSIAEVDGQPVESVTIEIVRYKWDGTFNPEGKARYREVRDTSSV